MFTAIPVKIMRRGASPETRNGVPSMSQRTYPAHARWYPMRQRRRRTAPAQAVRRYGGEKSWSLKRSRSPEQPVRSRLPMSLPSPTRQTGRTCCHRPVCAKSVCSCSRPNPRETREASSRPRVCLLARRPFRAPTRPLGLGHLGLGFREFLP